MLPLQVSLYVTSPAPLSPSVQFARFGARLSQFVFSTNQHGDESLEIEVPASVLEVFTMYSKKGIITVKVTELSEEIWFGRVEDSTLTVSGNKSSFSIKAFGLWRFFSDVPYAAFWSASDNFGEFKPGTKDIYFDDGSQSYEFNFNGQIEIAPKEGESFGLGGISNGIVARANFIIPSFLANGLKGVQFDFELSAGVGWQVGCQFMSYTPSAVLSTPWVTDFTASIRKESFYATYSSSNACMLSFFMYWTGAYPSVNNQTTGTYYLRIKNIRIVGNTDKVVNTTLSSGVAFTGLVSFSPVSMANINYIGQKVIVGQGTSNVEQVTITSISSSSFSALATKTHSSGETVQGHYVGSDQVVKAIFASLIANTSAYNFVSSVTSNIDETFFDLANEKTINEYPDSILDRMANLGDNRENPNLVDNVSTRFEVGYRNRMPFFKSKKNIANEWRVNINDLKISRSLNDMRNRIWTLSNGKYTDELNSFAQDSLSMENYGTRGVIINSGSSIAKVAEKQAKSTLKDKANPIPRASITFSRVYMRSGVRAPLTRVRGGDTITIQNLPVGFGTIIDKLRTFRILRTQYDAIANTITVEPESLPPELEFLLGRLGEGVFTYS